MVDKYKSFKRTITTTHHSDVTTSTSAHDSDHKTVHKYHDRYTWYTDEVINLVEPFTKYYKCQVCGRQYQVRGQTIKELSRKNVDTREGINVRKEIH